MKGQAADNNDRKNKDCTACPEECLKEGYLLMSQINLKLAKEGLCSDNDALELAEQNLAESE